MSLDTRGLVAALASHAAASGHFERVNGHEPKDRPTSGLTAGVWVQNLRPTRKSGLNSTSARVEFRVRIYTNMLAEPQDAIDPAVMGAVDALIAAYSADFDLGGRVRNVDLLGAEGNPLGGEAGYLNQAGVMMRVFDLTVPLIVNDAWPQVA
jgi:hypothetical protein